MVLRKVREETDCFYKRGAGRGVDVLRGSELRAVAAAKAMATGWHWEGG